MASIFSPEKKKEIEQNEELKKNLKRPDLSLEIVLENIKLFQSNVKSNSEICKNSE